MAQIVPFSHTVEVNGENRFDNCQFVFRVYAFAAIKLLEANGICNPQPGQWYSQCASLSTFKEIATKLYAQYVQGKKTAPLQLITDSSMYQYSGYTPDVRNVFEQVNMKPVDSASKNTWSIIYSNNYKPVIKANPVFKNQMPNLYHMTLKDALYEIENRNMKVVVKGRGKVVAQDIAPGAAISKGQTVNLLLN